MSRKTCKKRTTCKKRKTYKKKRTTYKKKRTTYKKKRTTHGGMFPRVIIGKARGLAFDTLQAKIERSNPYSETQKNLEENIKEGVNKFYSFTNDENKNTINYDRFSPKKSINPLSVPKKVFQTKNLYTNQVENVLSQPNFEI
jgi:hypothetical protein